MAAKSAALEIRPEAVEPTAQRRGAGGAARARGSYPCAPCMAEPDAGFRAVGVLYQEFVVRCRIEGPRLGRARPRRLPPHADARPRRARRRHGDDDGWQDVSLRASLLPEDMQGVFMMIARAAKEGWPCPGDAAIARAYGSHSLRRARRLLSYIEEQGLIVVPARRRRPAHRDAGRTGLGDRAGRPQCRGTACGPRLRQSRLERPYIPRALRYDPSRVIWSIGLERCLHQGRQCRNGVGDLASRPPDFAASEPRDRSGIEGTGIAAPAGARSL